MTTGTLALIAPEQFDALKRGDETVLADLFKADYDPLEQAAEQELHDPAAAARAVEHAFVHAYADLDKVQSPEGFNAALVAALHEETARERRRLNAAHRMAASQGREPHAARQPVSVDDAWRKVQEALHPKAVDAAGAAALRREEAKHHAAAHVKELGNKRSGWVVGGAVMGVAVLATAAVLWLDKGSEGARVTAALNSPDAASVKTEPGQSGSLKLSDGGEVSLAPASLVKVPPGYNSKWRAVLIEGAATITVAPNATLPFEARLGRAAVVATGTRFAVRRFDNDGVGVVRVLEGSVSVRLDDVATPVAAGQAVVITDDAVRPATPGEAARLTGWVDGVVHIETTSLEAALPEMRRWWGLVITIADPAIASRPVSMRAPASDPTAAIRMLEQAANVTLAWENKQMVLRPAPTRSRR